MERDSDRDYVEVFSSTVRKFSIRVVRARKVEIDTIEEVSSRRSVALARAEELAEELGLRVRDDRLCLDCKGDQSLYMVRKEVWALTGLTYSGGVLCLSCLSARIDRPLVIGDFGDFVVNEPLFFGYRLGRDA